MPAHALGPERLWQLVAYIRSIDVSLVSAAESGKADERLLRLSVQPAELAATSEPGNDWLTYSGSYSSTRHSALAQIHTGNADRLAIRWIHQLEGDSGRIECSPLVRDGVMFVTVPPGHVMALDAGTGHTLWRYVHEFTLQPGGEGPGGQNRGVALLNDKVFYGTWDAKLEALSAATAASVGNDGGQLPGLPGRMHKRCAACVWGCRRDRFRNRDSPAGACAPA
jgi:glucose dehydrogenase